MKLPEPVKLGVRRDWANFGVYIQSYAMAYKYLNMLGGSVWEREDQLRAFWRTLGGSMIIDTKAGQTSYCPMCEDQARRTRP